MSEETKTRICLRNECWYEGEPRPRSAAVGCFGAVVGLVLGVFAMVAFWIAMVIVYALLPFLELPGSGGDWGIGDFFMLALSFLPVPIGVVMGFSWGRRDCPVCGGDMDDLDSESGRRAQLARDNFRNLRGS